MGKTHFLKESWIFWYWLYVRDPKIVREKNPHYLISAENVFRVYKGQKRLSLENSEKKSEKGFPGTPGSRGRKKLKESKLTQTVSNATLADATLVF